MFAVSILCTKNNEAGVAVIHSRQVYEDKWHLSNPRRICKGIRKASCHSQGETARTLSWFLQRRGEPSRVVQFAAEGKISPKAHAWLKEPERPGLLNLGSCYSDTTRQSNSNGNTPCALAKASKRQSPLLPETSRLLIETNPQSSWLLQTWSQQRSPWLLQMISHQGSSSLQLYLQSPLHCAVPNACAPDADWILAAHRNSILRDNSRIQTAIPSSIEI